MIQLEEKCQNMEVSITRFTMKFDFLRQKILPNPLVIHDKLMKQDGYDKKMREISKDQTKLLTSQGIPTGKVLYKNFENLFYPQHEVKHLFLNKPTFSKYTKAYEIFRRMMKTKFLETKFWENITDLL